MSLCFTKSKAETLSFSVYRRFIEIPYKIKQLNKTLFKGKNFAVWRMRELEG